MNSKKTRKALIGTFIGMMALTAASAATAGVAWFTTTRTATVSFPNASVASNRGDLLVGAIGTNGTGDFYQAPDYEGTMDSMSSADGVNFFNAMLDVDGTELGKFYKMKSTDVRYAQFAFAASTQAKANTDLGVYLDSMTITVTNTLKAKGDGENKNFKLQSAPASADKILSVEVDGAEKQVTTDWTLSDDTVTFIEAPAPDKNVEIKYEVPANDPILNSVRVAFFAKSGATLTADAVVGTNDNNLMLLWDTTDDGSETHRAVKVVNPAFAVAAEEHYIRAVGLNYVDLDYVPVEDGVETVSYQKGTSAAVELDESKYTVEGRRITLNYNEIARGDKIIVKYTGEKIDDEELGNVQDVIDAYYAGSDLKATTTDGDLTQYGAYLGEIQSSLEGNATPLNVVARVWIEGTDEQHDEKGDEYPENDKDSIDVSDDNYEVGMDLKLVGIDVDVA